MASSETQPLLQGTPRSSSPSRKPAARRFRINRLLGRIVPLVLAVYMGFAYRLAIPQYAIGHLWRHERRHLASASYTIFNHVLFLISLRAYLRVYLAYDPQSGPSWFARLLGRRLVSNAEQIKLEDEADGAIWECDGKGERLRCWRDSCDGRLKASRTRHCSDCGTCRPGLDHHCPWFDADVCLTTTLKDFTIFLAFIPVLLFSALGPLAPVAWRHARIIWRFSRASEAVRRIWWERKRSWVGGPMYRWAVGWVIGAYHLPATKPVPGQSPLYGRPSAGPPVILAIGLLLVPIASGLLLSTLTSLSRGETTLDVSRRRALLRTSSSPSQADSPSASTTSVPRLARFYSVPTPTGRVVVPEPSDAVAGSAYDLGSRTRNLLVALGLTHEDVKGQPGYRWRLSEPFKKRLRAEAERRR